MIHLHNFKALQSDVLTTNIRDLDNRKKADLLGLIQSLQGDLSNLETELKDNFKSDFETTGKDTCKGLIYKVKTYNQIFKSREALDYKQAYGYLLQALKPSDQRIRYIVKEYTKVKPETIRIAVKVSAK